MTARLSTTSPVSSESSAAASPPTPNSIEQHQLGHFHLSDSAKQWDNGDTSKLSLSNLSLQSSALDSLNPSVSRLGSAFQPRTNSSSLNFGNDFLPGLGINAPKGTNYSRDSDSITVLPSLLPSPIGSRASPEASYTFPQAAASNSPQPNLPAATSADSPENCNIWDCFDSAAVELAPCGCFLCREHVKVLMRNARLIQDSTAENNLTKKKVFECVACRTRSQSNQTAGQGSQTGQEYPTFSLRYLNASASNPARKISAASAVQETNFQPRANSIDFNPISPKSNFSAQSLGRRSIPASPESLRQYSARSSLYQDEFPTAAVVNRFGPKNFEFWPNLNFSSPDPTAKYLIKIENIPFSTTIESIRNWLPAGSLPAQSVLDHPIHIIVHRQSGRTLPHCYVETVSPAAGELIIRQRDRQELGDRRIRVKRGRTGDLMRDLFAQDGYEINHSGYGFSVLTAAAHRIEFRNPILLELDLQLLAKFCARQENFRDHLPDTPFMNIISILHKFPWTRTELYTPQQRDAMFELGVYALDLAVQQSQIFPMFTSIADLLRESLLHCCGFRSDQKEKVQKMEKPVINQHARSASAPCLFGVPNSSLSSLSAAFQPNSPARIRNLNGAQPSPAQTQMRSPINSVAHRFSPSFEFSPSNFQFRSNLTENSSSNSSRTSLALPHSPPDTPPIHQYKEPLLPPACLDSSSAKPSSISSLSKGLGAINLSSIWADQAFAPK